MELLLKEWGGIKQQSIQRILLGEVFGMSTKVFLKSWVVLLRMLAKLTQITLGLSFLKANWWHPLGLSLELMDAIFTGKVTVCLVILLPLFPCNNFFLSEWTMSLSFLYMTAPVFLYCFFGIQRMSSCIQLYVLRSWESLDWVYMMDYFRYWQSKTRQNSEVYFNLALDSLFFFSHGRAS